jgi:two-component system CheB/CheR fusion protein
VSGTSFSLADAAPLDAAKDDAPLPFPTVAIGASAGGVDALRRLFAAMPADTGCAFVVVMHLDPQRDSMLAPLLGRATTMPVVQASDGVALAPNSIYTVPPGKYLEMVHGKLATRPIEHRPPRPKAVDHFMVSLAADQRERAIGIVLTGSDGDGALGVKAIKSEGGMTIAQSAESAAHAGMPTSAVATGMIDRQLTIEQIPAVLVDYVANAHLRQPEALAEEPPHEASLFDALSQVHAARGLDFRGYKKPMLLRRLRRRMGLARIGSLADYLAYLKATPEEANALANDLLISVTEFFREPEAWAALAGDIVPQLLARKQQGDALRIWVPGCASGEEAYSLAMVFLEQPRVADLGLRLQVFATDVDRDALDIARAGRYASAIEQSISPQRLQHFFQKAKDGGYRVRKELREVVLFAPHNVIADPPFSRMDLISCRNLLIYMELELQRRLLQTFHFALDTDGFLFLGKSETVGAQAAHFTPASQRSRIYRRTGAARLTPPHAPSAPAWSARDELGRPGAVPPRRETDFGKVIREALLEHRGAAAILATRDGQALYFYGPVQTYLQHPEGAPTSDLFAMLRDELRPHVRAAMHKASHGRQRSESTAMLPSADGGEQAVRLTAAPLTGSDDGFLLLTFERMESPAPVRAPSDGDSSALRALEDELRGSKRELRAAIEELEATNEELKVANEEAMSVNEELQSSNEELETSKEELQSVNEELTTVNHELEGKVAELERSNNDLNNLLSSTHIPTLFLDRELRIKRFTPITTRLFSLIATDIDRPLSDIAARCDIRALLQDAQRVLEQLAPLQHETSSAEGEHFLRRTVPYRTAADRIEGVVITFIDITEIKRAAEGLRRFAAVVQSSSDAIIVHDLQGKVLAWNGGAQALYGYSEAEALNASIASMQPEEARAPYEAQLHRLLAGETVQGAEIKRRTRSGEVIDVSASLSVVRGEDGMPSAVALIERDITRAKRAEAQLRDSEQRFRTLADSAPVLIWLSNDEGRIEFANNECAVALGQPAAALRGRRWSDLLHPDDEPRVRAAMAAAMAEAPPGRLEASARVLREGGQPRWMKIVTMPRSAPQAGRGGHVGCMIDIHEQVDAGETLRAADRRKDEFLAMLGHELRNPLAPIRNAAEILGRIGGDDTRMVWVRDTLVRQVEHVTRLVDDLLDISRVARGSMNLRLEPVDLGYAIAAAVDAVRPSFERRHQRFDNRAPNEPLWVEGDAIRLTQIFENLLSNAAKYTDDGGEISIELAREGHEAVVHVRDNGLGIADAMRGRVFDLFVQDERAVDRSQGGLGIGLALVQHLVRLHRGRVEAHSEGHGRGSDFVVRLPLLSQAAAPPVRRHELRSEGRGGRVLIVDDDADSARSLAMVLELSGMQLEQAHDLDSALRVASRFEPDVVLMDLAMPGADGYEVTRRLRALPELVSTRYIALSGFARPEDAARTAQEGFVHHFVKPVDPVKLERALQALLTPATG